MGCDQALCIYTPFFSCLESVLYLHMHTNKQIKVNTHLPFHSLCMRTPRHSCACIIPHTCAYSSCKNVTCRRHVPIPDKIPIMRLPLLAAPSINSTFYLGCMNSFLDRPGHLPLQRRRDAHLCVYNRWGRRMPLFSCMLQPKM